MTAHTLETSPRTLARTGGVLYLIIIAAGFFAQAYVRGQVFVPGDAAATAQNLLANESLYRFGFLAGLIILVCNIPLALVYYALFRPVNRFFSLLVVISILLGNAVEAVSVVAYFAPLVFLEGGALVGAFSPGQLGALSYLALDVHAVIFNLCLVFFGVDGLVAGVLIFRSGFLPRGLGLLVSFGGLCYISNSLLSFLWPELASRLFPFILAPAGVSELVLSLWLTLRGVNLPRWEKMAARITETA